MFFKKQKLMDIKEREKLDKERKELLYRAADLLEVMNIVEKIDVSNRDWIIGMLANEREKCLRESQVIFDLMFPKKS